MFRLFRMMRVEGRYDSAITMMDDALRAQAGILGTALFVGFTTWMTVSSLYYVVERRNLDMIYCGAAPDYCPEDIDTSLCSSKYHIVVAGRCSTIVVCGDDNCSNLFFGISFS